jgi:hypothetical protein
LSAGDDDAPLAGSEIVLWAALRIGINEFFTLKDRDYFR